MGLPRRRRPTGLEELERAHLRSLAVSRAEPEALARRASGEYGWPAGFLARYFEKLRYHFGPRERQGLVRFFELAHLAGELDEVPELRFVDVRSGWPDGGGRATTGLGEVLDKALSGERISDDDARTLLGSRELVAIGRVAHELRCRRTPADRVTFVVDRNLNYTNICYTDCNFCAFYRRPGDTREGYTLPRPVIYKKIEETLAMGGTALLMQGGHNPELGIDWYEDLFRSIKARYPIHLHALSPQRGAAHRAQGQADAVGDAVAAARRRPRLAARRRRRDPGRSRAHDHLADQDQLGRVARRSCGPPTGSA